MSEDNSGLFINRSDMREYLDVIKDLDNSKIPARFIEKIVVIFEDESVIELSGEEFSEPFPVEGAVQWAEIKKMFKNVKDMKLHLNIFMIEYELEQRLDDLYGGLVDRE